MADTDLPGGFGAIQPAPRRPRPIASRFGMLSNPWATPDPNQTPGFNVQPNPPPQTNPMASLLASFVPSGQDLKQGVANTLGAPADSIAWMLHRMGLPIPGGVGGDEQSWLTRGINGENIWRPGPSVPLGSSNISAMVDNAPSLEAMLRAMRRPGLF